MSQPQPEQPTLPLITLPFPLILLPAARVTFPITHKQADALIHLIDSSLSNPVLAAAPLIQFEGNTSVNKWGVTARITRFVRPRPQSDDPYLLTLTGIARLCLVKPPQVPNDYFPLPRVDVTYPAPDADSPPSADIVQDFKAAAIRLLERFAQDNSQSARKRESWSRIAHLVDETEPHKAAALADAIVSAVGAEHAEKLILLSTESPSLRLQHVTNVLTKQLSIVEVSTKIATAVDESLSKQQKALFLRQQLAAINAELQRLEPGNTDVHGTGNGVEDEDELDTLIRRVDTLPPGSEVRRIASAEARRLKRIPPQNAEHGVVRNYSQLDEDHFGLDKVKRRLIEYLAVVRLRALIVQEAEAEQAKAQEVTLKKSIEDSATATDAEDKEKEPENACRALVKASEIPASSSTQVQSPPKAGKGIKAPILLFVGPPGTGKTSLGQSIARALGRPFQRIALGGVRDEAEIRGHRRTYVASGPGLLAQALRKAGRMDPVLLLDEIDKVGQSNYHGDPSAALLEVLDPEQNVAFNDHYVNVPMDLSQVLFICTANSLDTIAPPLLDRCEVIQLSGYTHDEKLHIARRFLLPKQLTQNGLSAAHVQLTEPALLQVVTHYTREAGVRALERAIGGVVRFKAVEWAGHVDARGLPPSSLPSPTSSLPASPLASETTGALVKRGRDGDVGYDPIVEADELENILGLSRYDGEDREREARRGVVWGLVVTGMGEGEIMPVESIATPGNGHLKLTGSLGDVIKESAELALSWVKMHSYDLSITNKRAQDPLRIPDATIDVHLHFPAGAQKKDGPRQVCAIVSLLTGKCVPPTTAMTGEITLRGRVSPVGGIKEKVLGAHRAGANKDVEHDVPKEVRARMQFVFARTVREALDAAFGSGTLSWRAHTPLVESRL
ncbi:Lon protease C-terminal proteolytic domain-containing protein [Multifurca ochricompacta]|uniref:endopeptidase La n=1 Tax=Multifurca ochricompacta TaxID=376703 RepID=A0AAD4M1R8_9AGAM|nr:Lon protease C-terminal proteolytic domain-containing protein [Multifurca ochricompacta]